MKVIMQRRHVVRPVDYESVELLARIELDSENTEDNEYFEEKDLKVTASMLSEDLDVLLDSDVDRTLRLDGQHINDTHLWAFYEKE